ncbi:MAG TPA: LamG-like jellyroll fold domain-containing protein, partial [Telluria sp.]|nr:LamG-like jellyroll fold domain-containing protein [Telluria sp.]
SFLIETYFRAEPSGHGGRLVAKHTDTVGYALKVIDKVLLFELRLPNGGVVQLGAEAKVNDGKWHHIIAEADRTAGVTRLYVDGRMIRQSEGPGHFPGSLSNTADFVVGKDFTGEIDFLRVCRGTLKDANTTIEELYAWEFDGPQYRDFTGQKVDFAQRPAGALAK